MKKFTQVVDTCISIIDSFKRKPIFEQEDELSFQHDERKKIMLSLFHLLPIMHFLAIWIANCRIRWLFSFSKTLYILV